LGKLLSSKLLGTINFPTEECQLVTVGIMRVTCEADEIIGVKVREAI